MGMYCLLSEGKSITDSARPTIIAKHGTLSNNNLLTVRHFPQKKEYRCTPTFVNLKSNTMKNTVQRQFFCSNPQKNPSSFILYLTLFNRIVIQIGQFSMNMNKNYNLILNRQTKRRNIAGSFTVFPMAISFLPHISATVTEMNRKQPAK